MLKLLKTVWMLHASLQIFESADPGLGASAPSGIVAYRRVGQDVELTFIDPTKVSSELHQRLKQILISNSTPAPNKDKRAVSGVPVSQIESRQENRIPVAEKKPALDHKVVLPSPSPFVAVESKRAENLEPIKDNAALDRLSPHVRDVGAPSSVTVTSAPPARAHLDEVSTPSSRSSQNITTTSPPKNVSRQVSTTFKMGRNQTEPSLSFGTTQRKPRGSQAVAENGVSATGSFILSIAFILFYQLLILA